MAQVICRNCGFKGKVSLSRKIDKWSRDIKGEKPRLLAKKQSEKGKPATAIPCPKCKQHKLARKGIR